MLATWSGDVFDTTPGVPLWTNNEVQHVTGQIHVPAGKTLTIQPGTIIQFNYGDYRLSVDGTLNADGTAAQPIIFTSVYDSSPTGGTDNAGRGYWGSLEFTASSTANVMDHVEVRYGGWAVETITLTGAPLTLTNSLIRDSYRAAMNLDLAALPVIRDTTLGNNYLNAALVAGGNLPSDAEWNNPGIVYLLDGDVTVPAGRTLTIGAGQVIKSRDGNVIVDGTLLALGSSSAPVTFTSYRDDEAGGDTNGNGASTGFDGDWGAITFNPGSDASRMEHAVVRYGGYSGGVEAAVVIHADIEIRHSKFLNSYNGAVLIVDSAPTLSHDVWQDNVDRFNAPAFAIRMDAASRPLITSPTLIGNDINGVLVDSGEMTENTTWANPDIVYYLYGDVTVAAGTTLTIEPGQIVKSRGCGLIIHGTLHAVGASTAPILFTSYRDDSAGGDTNNDGPTQGDSPDWNGIELRADSANNVMDYTEVRFGGFDGAGLDYGAVSVAGSLTLSHSIVRESEHAGVLVEPNGVATLTDNLIINNGVAGIHAQANATLIAVNNTIDGNGGRRFRGLPFFGTGVILSSPTATLANNLITNNDIVGVFQDGLTSLTFHHNDVFNPDSLHGDYRGLDDPTGTNGNLSVDPKYFSRANLSYQLQPGSPVEDAGTSLGAPLDDFFGNPRFDAPNIAGRGDGSGYDLGAIESQLVATSTVDLATLNVSGPTTGTQEMTATVHWTVKNVGTSAAIGPWSDAIYLSDTPFWTPDARFLKRVTRAADLTAGETYDASADVTLTNVLPGDHYFLVRGNDRNEVFEGLSTANNTGAAARPITFAMPTLTLDTPYHDQFTGPGQAKYFKITVEPGQTLSFTLQSAAGGGSTELYVSRGSIPSRSKFDFRGGSAIAANQQITVPQTQPGVYYVLAYPAFGAAATSSFTMTVAQAEFGVQGVSPATVGNSGTVTLTITGARFEADVQASLIAPDNTVIAATAVRRVDATQVQATFNLAGKPTGAYGVRITQDAQSATSAQALTVEAGVAGHLKVDFIVPGGIRAGRQGTVTVEYTNDGGADLPAPILIVTSTSPTLRFTGDVNARGDTAEFLAINPTGDAGVLPPGARGSIDLHFIAPAGVATDSIQFTLASQSSQADTTPLDWTAAREKLRPSSVSPDAWEAIYANFLEDVGTTLGSFQALLDRLATYLSRLGEYVADEGELLALEFRQAGAFGAIAQRYQLGAFGRGMPDPTALLAAADEAGNVTILTGDRSRTFFLQSNHTYRGGNGDRGTLSLQNGAYRLREVDGTTIAFRTDGRLDYRQDVDGGRLTANYAGGRLVSFIDRAGQNTTFSYAPNGRVVQATDTVGRVTNYVYDASGEHLLSISDSRGVTRFAYVNGQGPRREHALESITYPDGSHVFFTYDDRGRVLSTSRDGGAESLTYSYDGMGGVTTTDALNHGTTMLTNALGQVALVRNALGAETQYRYDENFDLIQVVRPDGVAVSITPDRHGNAAAIVNSLGQRTDSTFDPVFNTLRTLRDPRGNTFSYQTDDRGNAISLTYPDGGVERYGYDAAGNQTLSQDLNGNAIRYSYDARYLLVRADFSDGSHSTFTYDSHSNLATATNQNGTTTFDFDLTTDRLNKVTYPGGRFLVFTYNSLGQRTSSSDQDGFTVNYAYDAGNRLSRVLDAAGHVIAMYAYDPVGRLERQDLGNGTYTKYQHDAAGQVTSIVHHAPDHSVISRFEYVYDALGRTQTMTTLDGTTRYGYDAEGQLTSVELPDGRQLSYQYDAAGNRTAVMDGGVTTSYATNRLNQYTTVGAVQFAYDANGNLTSRTDADGVTSYRYDLQGRLASVTSPSETITYVYDALGNRVAVERNGVRTEYLIDPGGLGNIVAEFQANGQAIAHYTLGVGLTSRVDAAGNAQFYAFDRAGNTSVLTAADGSVSNRYTYLPFGEPLSATASVPNAFTFGGQLGVRDDGHGLYFMRARSYDSSLGRFTQTDPIRFAGGVNLYRFARNNPVSNTDPSGLVDPATLKAIEEVVNLLVRRHGASVMEPIVTFLLKTSGVGSPWDFTFDAQKLLNGLRELAQRGLPGGTPVAVAGGGTGATIVSQGTQTVVSSGGAAAGETAVVETVGGTAAETGVSSFATESVLGAAAVEATPLVLGAGGTYALWKITSLPPEAGPGSKLLAKCQELGFSTAGGACLSALQELRGVKYSQSVTPVDPNDLHGPLGFGSQHFVTPDQTFPYAIHFENLPAASAPALVVKVTQQLDAKLDWTTFELGDFGFGKYLVHVPAGRRFFHTRVDASDTRGEYVDITAEFDPSTGLATWLFSSVDPATGALPEGVTDGFLPPEDGSGAGQGFVYYRVRPKPPASTGTTIPAQARVIFEAGLPDESFLDTPVFTNTFDLAAPSSTVASLPTFSPPTFTVHWSGTDDPNGSGIATYDVYVADGAGPFTLWLDDTTDTSRAYVGTEGHTYSFYSVATDNAGHQELNGGTAETLTTTRLGPRWQNSSRVLDVSDDSSVSPVDALLVINELNIPAIGGAGGRLPSDVGTPPPFLDVNGDDFVSPVDALIVINYLNGLVVGEGEAADDSNTLVRSDFEFPAWNPPTTSSPAATVPVAVPYALVPLAAARTDAPRVRASVRERVSTLEQRAHELLVDRIFEREDF